MRRSVRWVIAGLSCLAASVGLAPAQWLGTLPPEFVESVLWHGDVEEGTLDDWTYVDYQFAGGGIFNTGEPPEAESEATGEVAHSGSWSARATIRNALQAQNGSRAVRMFRWTDRPWDDGGRYFPLTAYYSTWIYLPHSYNPNKYAPWDPGDGGWWNIFQFKSADEAGESQPIFTLDVGYDDARGTMELYMYTDYNSPASWGQTQPVPLPAGSWVHLEALYRQSSSSTGRIVFWQDGRIILNAPRVRTILAEPAHWSINNYTDHIAGGPTDGEATVYFDDAAVSTRRLSGALAPAVGAVADDMRVEKAVGGVELTWSTPCPSTQFHALFGTLSGLPAYAYQGAVCDLGPAGRGSAAIDDPPPGDLVWWVVVAAEGLTESHHGFDSTGLVRPAQAPGLCGLTRQSEILGCP